MPEASVSKERFLAQLETEFLAWQSKINELKVKKVHVRPEVLSDYETAVRDLEVRLNNIRLYQAEIYNLPDQVWQNLQDVIKLKGSELDQAIRDVMKRYE
jgi:hypothetical protein